MANSVATVDNGEVGNTPFKYFDNKHVFELEKIERMVQIGKY